MVFTEACWSAVIQNVLWQVSPANMMVTLCQQQNGRIVIIDPDSSLSRKADVMLCGPAGTILPRLSEMASHLRNVSSWVHYSPTHSTTLCQFLPLKLFMFSKYLSNWAHGVLAKSQKHTKLLDFLPSSHPVSNPICALILICAAEAAKKFATSESGGSLL